MKIFQSYGHKCSGTFFMNQCMCAHYNMHMPAAVEPIRHGHWHTT